MILIKQELFGFIYLQVLLNDMFFMTTANLSVIFVPLQIIIRILTHRLFD